MIKLRLQRKGRKKRPYYHIVVADSRAPRDGRIIEKLGRFDNVSQRQELVIDEDRIIHWLKIGATPSDTVRSILKVQGILYKMHLIRWGKSEEEIEAALEEWRTAREEKGDGKELSRKEKQEKALKAEEQEYKKQLEEKAAAAAKELEKQKEETKAEEETATESEEAGAKAETEEATAEETKAEVAPSEEKEEAPEPEVKAEEAPKEEEVVDEKPEAKAEEPVVEPEKKAEASSEETKEKAAEPEVKAEETEPKAETEEVKEEKKAESPSQVSTDMNANEAIDHIKDTPLDKLKGFVPEGEDRVTVLRAWESKQSE